MSQLSLKKIKLGDNADLSKNFVISVPAVADGTLTIERENGTDALSIDANGKAKFSFGIFGFAYGSNANGQYIKTPSWLGNLLIQWGTYAAVGDINGDTRVNYPTTFSLAPIVICSNGDATAASYITVGNRPDGLLPTSSITVRARLSNTGAAYQSSHRINWIAIGSPE